MSDVIFEELSFEDVCKIAYAYREDTRRLERELKVRERQVDVLKRANEIHYRLEEEYRQQIMYLKTIAKTVEEL